MTVIGRSLDVFGPTRRFGEYFAKDTSTPGETDRGVHGGSDTSPFIKDDYKSIRLDHPNLINILKKHFHRLYTEDEPVNYKELFRLKEAVDKFMNILNTEGWTGVPANRICSIALEEYLKITTNAIKLYSKIEDPSTISDFISGTLSCAQGCAENVSIPEFTRELGILASNSTHVAMIMRNYYQRTEKK